MADQLKDTVRKLLAEGRTSALAPDELARLEEFAGPPSDTTPGETARPLWHWVRSNYLRWANPLELESRWGSGIDQGANIILGAAGAKDLPSSFVGRFQAPVTREGLRRACQEWIVNRNEYPGTGKAALLAALAGFQDLLPHLVRLRTSKAVLSTLFEDAIDQALIMLGYDGMPEILGPGDSSREARVLLCHYERHPEEACLEALVHLFALLEFRHHALLAFPRSLRRYVELGGALDPLLKKLDPSSSSGVFHAIAPILASGDLDSLKGILKGEREGPDWGKSALYWSLLLAIGAEKCEWALPAVIHELGFLEDAREPQGEPTLAPHQASCVWAFSALEATNRRRLEEYAHHAQPGFRAGLALAASADSRLGSLLTELVSDSDTAVAYFATLMEAIAEGRTKSALISLMDESPGVWKTHTEWLMAAVLAAGSREGGEDFDRFNAMLGFFDLNMAISLFRDNPWELVAWGRWSHDRSSLSSPNIPTRVSRVACSLSNGPGASIVEPILLRNPKAGSGPVWREYTEVGDFLAGEYAIEIAAARAPRSQATSLIIRLLAASEGTSPRLTQGDAPIALAFLASGLPDQEMRDLLLRAIRGEEDVAPSLAAMVAAGLFKGDDSYEAEKFPSHVLHAAADSPPGSDPFTHTLRNVLENPEPDPVHPRELLLLLANRDDTLRAEAVPAVISGAISNPEEYRDLLGVILEDPSPAVRIACLSQLHRLPLDEKERDRILRDALKHRNDSVHPPAIRGMCQNGPDRFASELIRVLGMEDPLGDTLREAMEGLRRLTRTPDTHLLALSVATPKEICMDFSVQVNPFPSLWLSHDPKDDALKLLLTVLDARKSESRAAQLRGRQVLLQYVKEWPLPPMGVKFMTRRDFEEISIYLKVNFVDRESGAIVTEVGEEATGEFLNALFEEREFAVFVASIS